MGASTRAYEDDIRPSCSAADLARLHALDSQAKQPGLELNSMRRRAERAETEVRELRAALHSVKVSPE
jgi:hypothetical protein